MTRSLSCKICSADGLQPKYKLNGYDIYQCPACGFGQVFADAAELAAFYDKEYFNGEKARFAQEEGARADPAHRFWLEQQLRPFGKNDRFSVLEIGPGLAGQFAREVRERWPAATYEAIEISDFATEKLRAAGFTVHLGRIASREVLDACASRFDLVIGTEVIEHDPEPHEFARSVAHVLKPGGSCAFTTGNLAGLMARWNGEKWYYLDPPAHVSYFTPTSARKLFDASGFERFRAWKIGFNYIDLQLKLGVPGVLFLADMLSLPTGMSISAVKT